MKPRCLHASSNNCAVKNDTRRARPLLHALPLALLLGLTAGCKVNAPSSSAPSVQGEAGGPGSAMAVASTSVAISGTINASIGTKADGPGDVQAAPPTSSSASASIPAPASAPDKLVREFHPSGPTVVRTWNNSTDALPERIELTHARSGRRLVGQARLRRESPGRWFIETSAGEKISLSPASIATFEESAERWRVQVLRQQEPVVQRGIATEGEPNLDLVLQRQH